jgi:hypothetical protein
MIQKGYNIFEPESRSGSMLAKILRPMLPNLMFSLAQVLVTYSALPVGA